MNVAKVNGWWVVTDEHGRCRGRYATEELARWRVRQIETSRRHKEG